MGIFDNKPLIPRNVRVEENDVDSDGDYIVRMDRNWQNEKFNDGELVIIRITSKYNRDTTIRRTLGTLKYHSKIGDWIVRLFDIQEDKE